MNDCQGTKSNSDYGHRLLNSGLEGALSGGEAFLGGRPLAPFLNEAARNAATAAAIGAGVGLLSGFAANRHKSAGRALLYGMVGCAIGFGAGVVWENRRLGASMVCGALKNIGKVRDERWLEKHPIDYA